MTILSGLAIAILSTTASLLAFWVVRQSLFETLERGLRADVRNLTQVYTQRGEGTVVPQEGPTGGIHVQLYGLDDVLLAGSSELYTQVAIDASVVRAAAEGEGVRMWRGTLDGRQVSAALLRNEAPSLIVAVLATTGHINVALRQLAQALALSALLLSLVSTLVGYLVAATSMKPITALATLAAKLDAEHLEPIPYRGPPDEVGQLASVLNDLTGRLKVSFDAQRAFLAETSHELRTPLTSLQGFLDRAVRRAGPEAASELQDARRISQTMSRLVADLLQLSRGELVREYDPHLLDPYLDIVQPVAEEFSGVRVEAKPGLLLLGDPERLRQLVRNLTANAVRAAGGPEGVRLELSEEEGNVVMRVRDRGPGIAPETLPHIFGKFYRGVGGGTGLGLAIAKQIIDTHQGEIGAESKDGEGSVFTVRLPAFLDEADEDLLEQLRVPQMRA